MGTIYNQDNVKKVEVPDLEFRKLKFQLESGSWVDRHFKTKERLNNFLVERQPINCYMSVSLYNNKKRFKSEFVVDIDNKGFNFKNFHKLIILLGCPKRIVRTSERGIHLFWDNVYYRRAMINHLKDNKVEFDYDTSLDRTRVVRMPFTINCNRNDFQTYTLEGDANCLLSSLASLQECETEFNSPSTNIRRAEKSHLQLPSHFFYHYLLPECKKELIYFRKFSKEFDIGRLAERLSKRIGRLFLIDYGIEFALISENTYPKSFLKKIDYKWKRSLIRVTGYYDINSRLISEHPKGIRIWGDKKGGNFSEYHRYWLNHLFKCFNRDEIKKPKAFIGEFKNKNDI